MFCFFQGQSKICHCVKKHLKSGQNCPDFQWARPTIWKPDRLKYVLQKVRMSDPHCIIYKNKPNTRPFCDCVMRPYRSWASRQFVLSSTVQCREGFWCRRSWQSWWRHPCGRNGPNGRYGGCTTRGCWADRSWWPAKTRSIKSFYNCKCQSISRVCASGLQYLCVCKVILNMPHSKILSIAQIHLGKFKIGRYCVSDYFLNIKYLD